MTFHALEGLRVVDLGIVTAGATTSALLADLGADVIKVEGPAYTDPFREWTGVDPLSDWWNRSAQFRATNRNKRSVCLDLKSKTGHALFLQLVAGADLVLENFRCGVLERLGIGFDRLVEANPRIILASISSQGQTGPAAMQSSFGSTLEASSGMAALMRYPGGRPQITGRGMNYPDQVAALFSASAIVAALVERRRTGRPMLLDLSQRELTAYLVGEELMAAGAGIEPRVVPSAPAPSDGIFQAADGEWVAVGWAALAPGADLPRDAQGMASFVARHPAAQAAQLLRQGGAAAEVAWSAGVPSDPLAPALPAALGHDTEGHQVKGLGLRMGGQGIDEYRAAPALGGDNAAVARDLLGLSPSEFEALCGQGVFAVRPAKADKMRADALARQSAVSPASSAAQAAANRASRK